MPFAFLDQWSNRPSTVGETNSGKDKVERTGVIPMKRRIELYLQAGANLRAHRAELYDYQEGQDIPPDAVPPTVRSANFDRADASMELRKLYAQARSKYKQNIDDIAEFASKVEAPKPAEPTE